MKPVTSVVEAQLDALIEGLERDFEERRRELLDKARAQARVVLRQARRSARTRARQAVATERSEREASLRRARASFDSRLRRMRQSVDLELLQQSHAELRDALLRRWQDPAARMVWLALTLEEAGTCLPPGNWRLEYPQGQDPQWLREGLDARAADGEVELIASAELKAGFRLTRAGAVLDLGLDGLLSQGEELAGLLLAELHRRYAQEEENPL